MIKFISWIVMLVVGIAGVFFAVANRDEVTVDLWPLPIVQPLPLFMTVLGAALIGFLAGGVVTWFSSGGVRRRARVARRQVSSMEKDLATLQQRTSELEQRQKQTGDA